MARKHARPKPASGRKPSTSHGSRSASGGRVAKEKAKALPAKAAKPKAAVQTKAPPAPPKVKFHGRMLENEPLSRYTTWRLGGPARFLLQPADVDDIVRGLEMARERGLPWLVLGLG